MGPIRRAEPVQANNAPERRLVPQVCVVDGQEFLVVWPPTFAEPS